MPRLMPLLPLLAVGAACFSPPPKPSAVSNEPLGGPCVVDADCATGLACVAFQYTNGAAWEGGNLCTITCSASTACPSGSACVSSSSAPSSTSSTSPTTTACVPLCQTDEDCRIGKRAQTCVTVVDAGVRICEELVAAGGGDSACPAPNCGTCPSGFHEVANPGQFGFCQAL